MRSSSVAHEIADSAMQVADSPGFNSPIAQAHRASTTSLKQYWLWPVRLQQTAIV